MFLDKIPKKTKIILAVVFAILILLGVILSLLQKQSSLPSTTTTLSQEQLAALAKPAVVRIIQHATGEITLPALNFDLTTLSVSINTKKAPTTQKIDKYLSGSGVIINPNGFILTNAHVISPDTLKQMYVEELLKSVLAEKTKGLSDADLDNLGYSQETLLDFLQRSLDTVEKNTRFEVSSKLTVLSPDSTQESMQGLLQNGFPAKVIDYDKNFLDDEKDVALISIDVRNLPALALGDDNKIATGNRIFVFGFPSTAELNQRNPLEASFTTGLISAIKFSKSKDFRIFQTDAKISEGSSGGPLLNDQGEVVGLITFQTGEAKRTAGDNFAFAVPISLTKPLLQQNHVPNIMENYAGHFKAGLDSFSNNECGKAIKEFELVSQTNQRFIAANQTQPYIKKCEELILKGKSLDSVWQQFISWFESLSGFTWFVVGGRIVLAGAAAWLLWLVLKRLQRDEQEIGQLSAELEEEKQQKDALLRQLAKKGITIPLPESELHAETRLKLSIPHPHIIEFINEARQIGLKDNHITEELSQAGWSQDEIYRALNHQEA